MRRHDVPKSATSPQSNTPPANIDGGMPASNGPEMRVAAQKFVDFARLEFALALASVPYRVNPLGRDELRDFRLEVLSAEAASSLLDNAPNKDFFRAYANAYPVVARTAAIEVRQAGLSRDSFGLPEWFGSHITPEFVALFERCAPDVGRVLSQLYQRENYLRSEFPELKLYFDKVTDDMFISTRVQVMQNVAFNKEISSREVVGMINDDIEATLSVLAGSEGLLEGLADCGAFALPD